MQADTVLRRLPAQRPQVGTESLPPSVTLTAWDTVVVFSLPFHVWDVS